MKDLEYIREMLSPADVWEQLEEEASELAQAASKMARLERGVNPPRKDAVECLEGVYEELADIENCLDVLDWCQTEYHEVIKAEKIARWAKVLRENAEKHREKILAE